jgi:hypothetical protein
VSTRTVIEINHDYLNLATAHDLMWLLRHLGHSSMPELRETIGSSGVRILGQRHHSEPEWKQERG